MIFLFRRFESTGHWSIYHEPSVLDQDWSASVDWGHPEEDREAVGTFEWNIGFSSHRVELRLPAWVVSSWGAGENVRGQSSSLNRVTKSEIIQKDIGAWHMTQLGKKQSNEIFDISIAGPIDMKPRSLIIVELALAQICYSP